MKTRVANTSIFIVLTVSILMNSSLFLSVNCTQIGEWNVRLLEVGTIEKAAKLQTIANFTSNIPIEGVELSYAFGGQGPSANVSMSFLNSSNWQGSTSTLWSAETPTPGTNFTCTESFYARNTIGNIAPFQTSFGVSELSHTVYETLLSPLMILLAGTGIAVLISVLISVLVDSKRRKKAAGNPLVIGSTEN